MRTFSRLSHDPGECRQALLRARVVTLDCETTGVGRRNRLVPVGLKVGRSVFVLFRHSQVVPNLDERAFRRALEPLARPSLILLMLNAPFDVEKLRREGVAVGGRVLDSLRLLRLLDGDRFGRTDHRHPPAPLDYRLKNVCRLRYGVEPPDVFRAGPARAETLPYAVHVRYLVSDLLLTERLVRDLWRELPARQRAYYLAVVEPLVNVLLGMREAGFPADLPFVRAQADRIDRLLRDISAEHRARFGVPLGLPEEALRDGLFGRLRLPASSGGRTSGPPARRSTRRSSGGSWRTPPTRRGGGACASSPTTGGPPSSSRTSAPPCGTWTGTRPGGTRTTTTGRRAAGSAPASPTCSRSASGRRCAA